MRQKGRRRITNFREFAESVFRSIDLWLGLFGSPLAYGLILKAIDGINLLGLTTLALENGFFCTIVVNEARGPKENRPTDNADTEQGNRARSESSASADVDDGTKVSPDEG